MLTSCLWPRVCAAISALWSKALVQAMLRESFQELIPYILGFYCPAIPLEPSLAESCCFLWVAAFSPALPLCLNCNPGILIASCLNLLWYRQQRANILS